MINLQVIENYLQQKGECPVCLAGQDASQRFIRWFFTEVDLPGIICRLHLEPVLQELEKKSSINLLEVHIKKIEHAKMYLEDIVNGLENKPTAYNQKESMEWLYRSLKLYDSHR